MRSYRLNKRILLQKETTANNSLGTPVETYTDFKNKWATVTYQGGNTATNEYGEIANTNTEFTIRYDPQVNYKCRIYYQGQYYKILHIEVIGISEGQRLRCIKFEDE